MTSTFKHMQGIQASSKGFEMIDNTQEVEGWYISFTSECLYVYNVFDSVCNVINYNRYFLDGLQELFKKANIPIELIHKPEYKTELDNFRKTNSHLLRGISMKKPPGKYTQKRKKPTVVTQPTVYEYGNMPNSKPHKPIRR